MNYINKMGSAIAVSVLACGVTGQALAAETDSLWDMTIEFGLTGKKGNSNTLDTNTRFDAKRILDGNTIKFGAAYFFESSEGDQTTNEFRVTASYDVPVDDTWSWFINGRYDHDEFEAWDDRVSVNGGMGYKIDLDEHEKDMDLVLKFGLGERYEFDSKRLVAEASFGFEYDWVMSKTQTFSASTTVYPDISDELGNSRVISEASWRIKLDTLDGLSLKFGIENEYESSTIDDSEHNDFKGMISLVYEF